MVQRMGGCARLVLVMGVGSLERRGLRSRDIPLLDNIEPFEAIVVRMKQDAFYSYGLCPYRITDESAFFGASDGVSCSRFCKVGTPIHRQINGARHPFSVMLVAQRFIILAFTDHQSHRHMSVAKQGREANAKVCTCSSICIQ